MRGCKSRLATTITGDMFRTPGPKRCNHRLYALTEQRDRIFDARPHNGIDRAADQPVMFQYRLDGAAGKKFDQFCTRLGYRSILLRYLFGYYKRKMCVLA